VTNCLLEACFRALDLLLLFSVLLTSAPDDRSPPLLLLLEPRASTAAHQSGRCHGGLLQRCPRSPGRDAQPKEPLRLSIPCLAALLDAAKHSCASCLSPVDAASPVAAQHPLNGRARDILSHDAATGKSPRLRKPCPTRTSLPSPADFGQELPLPVTREKLQPARFPGAFPLTAPKPWQVCASLAHDECGFSILPAAADGPGAAVRCARGWRRGRPATSRSRCPACHCNQPWCPATRSRPTSWPTRPDSVRPALPVAAAAAPGRVRVRVWDGLPPLPEQHCALHAGWDRLSPRSWLSASQVCL
jgi:hypothetical protein